MADEPLGHRYGSAAWFRVFHELWSDAVTGGAYNKRTWLALEEEYTRLADHAQKVTTERDLVYRALVQALRFIPATNDQARVINSAAIQELDESRLEAGHDGPPNTADGGLSATKQ
jgi:hypothetical protein